MKSWFEYFISLFSFMEKDRNSVLIYVLTWFLIFIIFFNYTDTPYFQTKFSYIFGFQLHIWFQIGAIFERFFFWKLSLKMCNCSCSAGNCNFSTYEWITMVTQILVLLVLTLILFKFDEKYIEKHVYWNIIPCFIYKLFI